jgi:S-adenosylmethionine:tRNA ribosyltransferase-isomerase
MKTDLFDYQLPVGLIAQQPAPVRDASRLMHVDRATGTISHHIFHDLPDFLRAGDCLVVNNSRVFPGRLNAVKEPTGGVVELLLLEKVEEATWSALTKGAKLRPGTRLSLGDGRLDAKVLERGEGGRALVAFARDGGPASDAEVFKLGSFPLPPYITALVPDTGRYQTVYAEREISAAAPTAGLHFTEALLARLDSGGVRRACLELAVGMDTFVPVREEEVEGHPMHSEWYSVSEGCAAAANAARRVGGRVVTVGTTVVRALESAASADGAIRARACKTSLFITPGYAFRAVDVLITNFHFPRSTLLMLVCAFGGTELILDAYRTAVNERYRFYSFGDAMIIT